MQSTAMAVRSVRRPAPPKRRAQPGKKGDGGGGGGWGVIDRGEGGGSLSHGIRAGTGMSLGCLADLFHVKCDMSHGPLGDLLHVTCHTELSLT